MSGNICAYLNTRKSMFRHIYNYIYMLYLGQPHITVFIFQLFTDNKSVCNILCNLSTKVLRYSNCLDRRVCL